MRGKGFGTAESLLLELLVPWRDQSGVLGSEVVIASITLHGDKSQVLCRLGRLTDRWEFLSATLGAGTITIWHLQKFQEPQERFKPA